mmetsp:Transcript_116033/g.300824  ORF Transcript_116033/g.300824 Transcript_116033/m.300824 type:complete len:1168 (+) Transcript_116033:66-3569(+)
MPLSATLLIAALLPVSLCSGPGHDEVAELRRQVTELQSQVEDLQGRLNLGGVGCAEPERVRLLAGGEDTSSEEHADEDEHDEHAGAHDHQHDALVYLVLMLIVGTMILHLTTLPSLHSLPYTVVLFVLGVACSLGFHALGDSKDSLGKIGRSYEMWMDIDPHLLIFTMLPMLLTGDAMTIDTSVAKRVSSQCVWLAGPGVLASAFAAGTFLYFYLQWDFLLCISMGSILAATDPVAVVGLLKELGASPTLTVQIQGESLLNDGTAMVLFFVAYDMLKGQVYDVKGIFLLLFYMVGCSWFLGMVIGGIFSSWIRTASKRLEHHSSMIQISLTLCCAYWSFVFSEGLVGISGVLSTVASGLILADNIWPKVVSKEAMHEVWHTFEYLGNTVIFFLAGALTGRSMVLIDLIDYAHLLVIYVVVVLIRGIVIFASRPLLRLLSPDRTPVSAADALVMTWGGLRGAVGLALAIQVWKDRAGGNIGEAEANRVLFFTGGIAMLTLIVNATTCPKLVNRLGITATPHAKARVLLNIHRRMSEITMHHRGPVKDVIDHLLKDVEHHIHRECPDVKGHSDSKAKHDAEELRPGFAIQVEYEAAKEMFDRIGFDTKELLGWDFENPVLKQEQTLLALVCSPHVEADMVKTINEAFLGLVRGDYWEQIDRGEFTDGAQSPDALLNSTTKAFAHANAGVKDFEGLSSMLGLSEVIETGDEASRAPQKRHRTSSFMYIQSGDCRGVCAKIIDSVAFRSFIVGIIVLNSIIIFLDPGAGSPSSWTFLAVDCVFMLCYLVELVLKLVVLRLGYFSSGWNALDFLCIVLGLLGIVVSFLVESGVASTDALTSEMMLIRLGRVVKLMRLMRIVVLVKFCRKMHAKYKRKIVSPDLGAQLEIIVTLRSFVQAHVRSHRKLLKFFGKQRDNLQQDLADLETVLETPGSFYRQVSEEGSSSLLNESEQARCIIESLTAVYRAIAIGAEKIATVEDEGPWILESMVTLKESCNVTEHLTDFIMAGANAGVIKEKDAELLMHPLHRHLAVANVLFSDVHAGIHRNKLRKYSEGIKMPQQQQQQQQQHGELVDGPPERNCQEQPLRHAEAERTAEMHHHIGNGGWKSSSLKTRHGELGLTDEDIYAIAAAAQQEVSFVQKPTADPLGDEVTWGGSSGDFDLQGSTAWEGS